MRLIPEGTPPGDRPAEHAGKARSPNNTHTTHVDTDGPAALLPRNWQELVIDAAEQMIIDCTEGVRQDLAVLLENAGPAEGILDVAQWIGVQVETLMRHPTVENMEWFRLVNSTEQPAEVVRELAWHERAQPVQRQMNVIDDFGRPASFTITRHAIGQNETDFNGQKAVFTQINFEVNDQWGTYVVLWRGAINTETRMPVIDQNQPVLLRIDSGCFSGMVLGDCQCDCCEQLHVAKETIFRSGGQGLIIEIPKQDGRGMGEHFKTKTLGIQASTGLDNVTTARLLAGTNFIDRRTYAGALAVFESLGGGPETPVRFMTNNKNGRAASGIVSKTNIFDRNEYLDVECVPLITPKAASIATHLRAKGDFLGHEIPHDTFSVNGPLINAAGTPAIMNDLFLPDFDEPELQAS